LDIQETELEEDHLSVSQNKLDKSETKSPQNIQKKTAKNISLISPAKENISLNQNIITNNMENQT